MEYNLVVDHKGIFKFWSHAYTMIFLSEIYLILKLLFEILSLNPIISPSELPILVQRRKEMEGEILIEQ